MTLTRDEHSADKYILSIKNDHMACVTEPLIILRNLIGEYLKNTPQEFSFFNYQDLAKLDIRALFKRLEKPLPHGLYNIVADMENKFTSYNTPLSPELAAMWVAFYKYYFRLLPVPNAGQVFERILRSAKNHTIIDRTIMLDNEIGEIINADPDTVDPYKITSLLRSIKFHKNNQSLTESAFFKALDLLLLSPRHADYSRELVNTLIFNWNTYVTWVSSISHIVDKIKLTPSIINIGNTQNYLCPVLTLLNKNNIALDTKLQHELIDGLFNHDNTGLSFLAVLETIITLDIFEQAAKDKIYGKIIAVLTPDKYSFYSNWFRILLAQEATRDKTLNSMLDLFNCPKELLDYYDKLNLILIFYNVFDNSLLEQVPSLSQSRDQLLDLYVTAIENNSPLESYGRIERFSKSACFPDHLKSRISNHLLAREDDSMSAIVAIFAIHRQIIPAELVNAVWEKIIKSFLNRFEGFQHRYISTDESSLLHNIIDKRVIPSVYYDRVVSALIDCLFTRPGSLIMHCPLLAEIYISLLSAQELEILSTKLMDLLSDSDSRNQQKAIIIMAELTQVGTSQSHQYFDLVMRTIVNKGRYFLVDIEKSLLKMAKTAGQKNELFEFAYQLLDMEVDRYFVARDILENLTLSSEQQHQLAGWIFNEINNIKTNTPEEKNLELHSILLFFGNIKIPDAWCGRFINLLLTMHDIPTANYHFCTFTETIIHLAGRIAQPIYLTLEQAVAFADAFHAADSGFNNYGILSKFISFLPVEIQIGLMTHAEKLPVSFSAFIIEEIYVRLEVEDSRREMPGDVWKHVWKFT